MRAGLALITAALNHVEAVGNDAGFDKELAILVVIQAPGVTGTFRKDFKSMLDRMESPDAGVDLGAFIIGSAWLANIAVGENAMTTVEPAVRAPAEGVERLVRIL